MAARIRPLGDADVEVLVELSMRAWAPVFTSLEAVLGTTILTRQHPDWRRDQEEAVRTVCAADDRDVWVAEDDEQAVIGFVVLRLHEDELMGEIEMVAVDPAGQGAGTGAALTDFALARLRDAGMTTAMVETGGDPGHAPARATYERAGFTLFPVARYFKAL